MFIKNWLLVQVRLLRNSFRQDKGGVFSKDLFHAGLIMLGLGFLYAFIYWMFIFIDRKGFSVLDFAFLTLSFTLTVLLPLIFYSALVCGLSFLFQKEEIGFYFSLPVRSVSVFTVKLFQVYIHAGWMVYLGFLTLLAAIQHYFNTGFLIYITGSIGFFFFLVIPVCIAAITILCISRVTPFIRARGILTVIGILVSSVLVAIIRLMQPEQLITAQGKMRLVSFIQNLHKPWMSILPSEWVSGMLFSQLRKDWQGVFINFVSLVIVSGLSAVFMYILARAWYKRIWADSSVLSVTKGIPGKRSPVILASVLPFQLRQILRKDILSFWRDTVEKGSILVLIPLSVVYIYSVFVLYRQATNLSRDPVFSFIYVYLFNLFYSSVVMAGLSGRWVFPSISAEGNNFKLIRSSALSLADFLKSKFIAGFIPLFVLGETLNLSASFILRVSLPFIVLSFITTGVLCWGITLLSLTLGMRQADFSIKAPLEFALSGKGILCLIWEFIFVAFVILLVAVPMAVFLDAGFSRLFGLLFFCSIIFIFCAIMVLLHMYRISISRLAKKQI